MSQRVTCPVCREWEIISNDKARGKGWKCSKCGADAAQSPTVVIRFGNHYINANRLTVRSWPGAASTTDAAKARQYPIAKAEKFRLAMLKANKEVELFTPESALAMQAEANKREADRKWFYAYEAEVTRLAAEAGKPLGEDWTYYIQGVGCSSYHFGYESYIAEGITPVEGAARFFASMKPRPVKGKRKRA